MNASRWATSAAAPGTPAEASTHSQEAVADTNAPAIHDAVDEFAQTRGADDLFDDDYTPITAPVEETTTQPAEYFSQPQQQQQQQQQQRTEYTGTRGAPRGPRGRGRGGRGGSGGANTPAQTQPSSQSIHAPDPAAATATDDTATEGLEDAPTGPKADVKKDGRARGDRSGTGGVKPERLTESQLSAKLANMALKNARLTAAHERSLQDEAAFTAREAKAKEVATQKRKEERVNRQAMMGEREKNRQRKLQAAGGREWDLEKKEEDQEESRGGRARRGAYGAVVGPAATSRRGGDGDNGEEREDLLDGSPSMSGRGGGFDGSRGRGRGGRGRGGRGGRGNSSSDSPRPAKSTSQAPPSSSDFPDLPASQTPKESHDIKPAPMIDLPHRKKEASAAAKQANDGQDDDDGDKSKVEAIKEKAGEVKDKVKDVFGLGPLTPSGEKKSWADQVEGASPVEKVIGRSF